MGILLTNTAEDYGFTRDMHHIDGSTHFPIDGVEFSQYDSINGSRVLHIDSKVDQGLVKLRQLIDSVITDECFADKQHDVRRVDMNKFSKLSHESLISLHSSRSINQHNIVMLILCINQSFFGNDSWIVFVSLLIEGNFKAGSMCCQLLDCTASEIVTPSKHHFQVTFGLEIVSSFGQRCRFSNTVDTYKCNTVDLSLLFGCQSLFKNVNVPSGSQ